MRTIYKFDVPIRDEVSITMPRLAKILHVADQGGSFCMWAQVDTEETSEQREFHVYGTGRELREKPHHFHKFIGTVVQRMFVWHIFELVSIAYHEAPDDRLGEW